MDVDGISGLKLYTDFISEEEEKELLRLIDLQEWNTSLSRRTQHYSYEYDYTNKTALTKAEYDIPAWCDFLIDRLISKNLLKVKPDQLIVNEYLAGQGIFPHTDNTKSFADGIVSISLNSGILMDFLKSSSNESREIYLQPRSAIVMTGDCRYNWRHGIAKRKFDKVNGVKVARQRRVSLTFRKML